MSLWLFASSWNSFSPIGLPYPVLIREFLTFLLSCSVMFSCCLLEAYSFLKGTGWGWLWGSGDMEVWEERREGKLWSGCIAWEKNLFSIIVFFKHIKHYSRTSIFLTTHTAVKLWWFKSWIHMSNLRVYLQASEIVHLFQVPLMQGILTRNGWQLRCGHLSYDIRATPYCREFLMPLDFLLIMPASFL